jgi:hypothetical protein
MTFTHPPASLILTALEIADNRTFLSIPSNSSSKKTNLKSTNQAGNRARDRPEIPTVPNFWGWGVF